MYLKALITTKIAVWGQSRTISCDRSHVFTWSLSARAPESTAITSTTPNCRIKSIEITKAGDNGADTTAISDNFLIKLFISFSKTCESWRVYMTTTQNSHPWPESHVTASTWHQSHMPIDCIKTAQARSIYIRKNRAEVGNMLFYFVY